MVIADDRDYILCGGDPPRGLSDETTSLGTMGNRNGKPTPALQHLEPGRLLLGEQLQKGNKGVVPQGELQGFWLQSHLQQPRQNDPKG